MNTKLFFSNFVTIVIDFLFHLIISRIWWFRLSLDDFIYPDAMWYSVGCEDIFKCTANIEHCKHGSALQR